MNENPKININNTKQQMRKGILEFCILLIISEKAAYASDILKKLKKSDLIVVEGTIYPLLSRLKNSGLLNYKWKESKLGPQRKYYTLTKEGKSFLNKLAETWNSLDKSISKLIKKIK